MRALVRTLGSLLIVFGAFLWLYAAAVAHTNHGYTPVAVAPAAKPAPPPSKSRHHTETTETKAPIPDPKPPTLSIKPSSGSKVVVVDGQGRHYRFEVDLHKSNEWFDTGIPVTADLDVLMFCGPKLSVPSCNGLVQASVSASIFSAKDVYPNQPSIRILTVLPDVVPSPDTYNGAAQLLHMPPQATQTIKLRLVGSAPDELDGYVIKVYVRVQANSHLDQYSQPQQLEVAELAKWVKQ